MKKFNFQISNTVPRGIADFRVTLEMDSPADSILLIQMAMDANPMVRALLQTAVATYEMTAGVRSDVEIINNFNGGN